MWCRAYRSIALRVLWRKRGQKQSSSHEEYRTSRRGRTKESDPILKDSTITWSQHALGSCRQRTVPLHRRWRRMDKSIATGCANMFKLELGHWDASFPSWHHISKEMSSGEVHYWLHKKCSLVNVRDVALVGGCGVFLAPESGWPLPAIFGRIRNSLHFT